MPEYLCVVIPVYNEAHSIEKNIAAIIAVLEKNAMQFNLVLVDDGSGDTSWETLEQMANNDARITAIRLSRNFGKEAAICAGLSRAQGDYYLVMDSDLQHPPDCIPGMVQCMQESGADVIDGVKRSRGKEPRWYACCASLFYSLLFWLAEMDMRRSSDFKLLRPCVVDALRSFPEGQIFFRGLVSWVGFSHQEYPFDVQTREGGVSSFSLLKRVKFSLDAILAYTSKPLFASVFFFAVFFFFSLLLGAQTLYNYLFGNPVSGFTTVILLILILGTVLLFITTVISLYIARIYEEVKNRPQYLVARALGEKNRTITPHDG